MPDIITIQTFKTREVFNNVKRNNFISTTFRKQFINTNYLDEKEKCAICFENFSNTNFGNCGHKFCNSCLMSLDNYKTYNCPMCRADKEGNY